MITISRITTLIPQDGYCETYSCDDEDGDEDGDDEHGLHGCAIGR